MMPTAHLKLLPSALRRLSVSLAVVLLMSVPAYPSAAQSNSDLSPLLERLRLIEDSLKDLQLEVYRGPGSSGTSAPPVAAPVETSELAKSAAHAEERFSDLEVQIQTLTGNIEMLGHQIGKAQTRLDKLIADIDFRLKAMEAKIATDVQGAGQAGSRPATQPTDPAAGQDVSVAAKQTLVSSNAPGTSVLGTIPAGDTVAAAPPPEPQKPKGVLPEGSVKDRYSFAFNLLRRLKTNEAEIAFKEFLDHHSDDPLAENARYWLGETYYARKEFTQAAAVFVEGYSKSPSGGKARDNLLKLGMSLSRLQRSEEACATFEELLGKFTATSDAKARTITLGEMGRAGCK